MKNFQGCKIWKKAATYLRASPITFPLCQYFRIFMRTVQTCSKAAWTHIPARRKVLLFEFHHGMQSWVPPVCDSTAHTGTEWLISHNEHFACTVKQKVHCLIRPVVSSKKTDRNWPDKKKMSTNPILSSIEIRDIEADWDDEGIFVYQAYNQDIAQWALQHQKLGGPAFKQGTRHQKSS